MKQNSTVKPNQSERERERERPVVACLETCSPIWITSFQLTFSRDEGGVWSNICIILPPSNYEPTTNTKTQNNFLYKNDNISINMLTSDSEYANFLRKPEESHVWCWDAHSERGSVALLLLSPSPLTHKPAHSLGDWSLLPSGFLSRGSCKIFQKIIITRKRKTNFWAPCINGPLIGLLITQRWTMSCNLWFVIIVRLLLNIDDG